MKEYARPFYHSSSWRKLRDFVFRRDRGLCQRCKKHNRIKPGKIVHHIEPLSPENIDDPTISLNADNLELVCKQCHEEIHKNLGYGTLNWAKNEPRVKFDSNGNIIQL